MKISYKFCDKVFFYEQLKKSEIEKLNFVLTNNAGDYLSFSEKNISKYQGLFTYDFLNNQVFKILDEIVLPDFKMKNIEYSGFLASRYFNSKISNDIIKNVDANQKDLDLIDEDFELFYDRDSQVKEKIHKKHVLNPKDNFYLAQSQGLIYNVCDVFGEVFIDLDIRKINDFDKWGRDYNVYLKDDILFVRYRKYLDEKIDYEVFFGVEIGVKSYNLIKEFIEKDYSYSKFRQSLHKRYVFRLCSFNVLDSCELFMGYGFCENDVLKQIDLLKNHGLELKKYQKEIFLDLTKDENFEKPITQDINVAYKLSKNAVYNFLNKNSNFKNSFCYAGFFWFSQNWARDELVGLRSFINFGEEKFVKEKLFEYLNRIDKKTGLITRINQEGSFMSCDSVFWLAKRFCDFVFYLDRKKRLDKVLSLDDLELFYSTLKNVFYKLIENFWDKENELLKVKFGDSWTDTVNVNFPLDIQVQFLEFISSIIVLGQILNKDDLKDFMDFEILFKTKIRKSYLRDNMLYSEPFYDKQDCNVFLAYYFCPDLFSNSVWNKVFDNSLKVLNLFWGGISSLNKYDKDFKDNYLGESNLSYHRGDSWFFINNICAICLNDLNEKKYRRYISKILKSSTDDILKFGTIGFSSEISSANNQSSMGCFAQFWSSSTYLELIDNLFLKK